MAKVFHAQPDHASDPDFHADILMTTKAVTRRSHPKEYYRELYFGGYLIGWIVGESAYYTWEPTIDSNLPSLLQIGDILVSQPTIRKIQDRVEEIIDERMRNFPWK